MRKKISYKKKGWNSIIVVAMHHFSFKSCILQTVELASVNEKKINSTNDSSMYCVCEELIILMLGFQDFEIYGLDWNGEPKSCGGWRRTQLQQRGCLEKSA